MPKYRVMSPQFTRGEVGSLVDLDDVPGLNVRALVKSRVIVPVVAKPKRKRAAADEPSDLEEND